MPRKKKSDKKPKPEVHGPTQRAKELLQLARSGADLSSLAENEREYLAQIKKILNAYYGGKIDADEARAWQKLAQISCLQRRTESA